MLGITKDLLGITKDLLGITMDLLGIYYDRHGWSSAPQSRRHGLPTFWPRSAAAIRTRIPSCQHGNLSHLATKPATQHPSAELSSQLVATRQHVSQLTSQPFPERGLRISRCISRCTAGSLRANAHFPSISGVSQNISPSIFFVFRDVF